MDIIIYTVVGIAFVLYATYLIRKSKKRVAEYKACNTVLTNHEPMTSACGLTLMPSTGRYISFDSIVETYKSTIECTGLDAVRGPDVQYISFTELGTGAAWGAYASAHKCVYINTDLPRNCTRDIEILKHEFIHYLMDEHGLYDENNMHNSELFGKCGRGIDTHDGLEP